MEEAWAKFAFQKDGINGESSNAGERFRKVKGKCVANNGPDKTNDSPVPFPVAIVGMGMRLPGGVSSGKEFWDFLVNKRDGHCPVPETRYNIEGFYDENREGSIRTKHAYFLQHDIAQLDTGFFGISKIEAEKLDPQQRLLLEVVWECMENAGQTDWRGTNIGCYVGSFGEDWLDLQAKDTQLHDRYRVMSAGDFALSNRISYEYDLQGPSVTIRTGCSSSMVGLHEACQALYSGECSSALVAGTSLIMSPTMSTTMSDNMVISHSGICRTFDAAADGYGRGEAVNVIYIKPLSEALANRDPIRAIIRSSSVNCDGRTPSITTPGSEAQERLIRWAYKRAGINEEDIGQTAFFECHGTGTQVGDQAEASVVANIFGREGIYMGAVKPNVGHSEGASGVTSIIKCALALENNTIPPNVHFRDPSPRIPFESAKLEVPTEPTPWPTNRRKRVSVNSFGIGGTNAHVILDSASELTQTHVTQPKTDQDDGYRLLLASAKSKQSIAGQIDGVSRYIETDRTSLHNLAYTLGRRRTHLRHRAFAIAGEDGQISTFEKGEAKNPDLIFIFTGQGAQWPTMGKELIEQSAQFRDDIRNMDRVLSGLKAPPSWSIEEELSKSEDVSRVGDAEFAQPLCTAIQIGLVNILRAWGVSPESVVGHSSGEIAAAYAAGAISSRLAIILSYFRGQAAKSVSMHHSGAMAAVALNPEQIRPYLKAGVDIACQNSPQSVTLSGDADILEDIISKIQTDDKNIFCRKLAVNVAYHSHHMEEARRKYEDLIAPYMSHSSSMGPLYSTVTGTCMSNPAEFDAAYWGRNLQQPVLFNPAMQGILKRDNKPKLFLEIGPHSALAGPVRQIIQGHTEPNNVLLYAHTLRRDVGQWYSLLQTAGQLYIHGAQVQLSTLIPDGNVLTDLHPYSWQHEDKYWSETRMVRDWRLRSEPHHELLGSRTLESSGIEPTWRNMLQVGDVPWLGDHRIGGDIIFPCAGYVAMVGEAIRQMTGSAEYSVKNLFMRTALMLNPVDTTELLTYLRPTKISDSVDSTWYDFTICAYQDDTWKKHCTGHVRPGSDNEPGDVTPQTYSRPIASKRWYDALGKRGLEYGLQFRRLESISASPSTHHAAAIINDEDNFYASHYALHPILIDQCLQLLSVAATHGIPRRMTRLCIPLALEALYVGTGRGSFALNVSCDASGGALCGSADLISEGRHVLCLQKGLFFGIQDPDSGTNKMPVTSTLHWTPDVDFLPLEKQLPHYGARIEDAETMAFMANLFIIETYFQTISSAPKAENLQKWLSTIRKEYKSMVNNDEHLLPEARQAFALTDEERRAKIDELESATKHAGSYPVYRLFKRILDSVHDVLEERVEPIDLLMEDGALRSFYDIQTPELRWGLYFSLLGHADPSIRVLEVGGGTGGDTAVALKGLKSEEGNWLYAKYTFTDISPGFLGEAKKRFKSYGNMEYKTLDISRDPMEQGFEEGSYDVILASNVVHATPRISETLGNLKRLLSSTGTMLMIELSCVSPMIDYIMGILPGWWLGEADGRADRPYITVDAWNKALIDAGFTGVDEFRYDNPEPYHLNAHILTKVLRIQSPKKGNVCFLYWSHKINGAQDLAKFFSSAGYTVEWYSQERLPPPDSNVISLVDLEGPFFHDMGEEKFQKFQSWIATMDGCLLWVTRSIQERCEDPRFGLLLGIMRNVRCEVTPHVATLELDKLDHCSLQPVVDVFGKLISQNEGSDKAPEYEYSLRDGVIQVSRYHWSSLDEQTRKHNIQGARCLDIDSYAMLDTLVWTCTGLGDPKLGENDVEVDIKYVGVNFRDMMILMGFISSTAEVGIEASGVVRRIGSSVTSLKVGDRVMVAGIGLACTRRVIPSNYCIPIDPELSLEDAATVLCVFATVIYSLLSVARLQKGQTVLIHSACGGVGLAAIQICKIKEAEIYATVGNEEKIQHLMSEHGIPRDHIFDSRSASFLPGVLKATNGKGVDIVLNSLSGELLHASWKCVAPLGKMLELGKIDFLGHGKLDMDVFAENRSFIGVDLLGIIKEQPDLFREMQEDTIRYFKEGKARPIRPVHVYDAVDAEKAFRYMQSGQHMGKIVIKMPEDPSELPMSRMHETASYFSPEKSYLLVGGLGGLGRAVATWMAEKGAKRLVFLSPSGADSAERQAFTKNLEFQGCSSTVIAGSVAKMEDVERAIKAAEMPIAGVIQLSMVLRDQSLLKMTYEEWTTALLPKVTGTWNLHNALKDVSLEFFVLISSITGIYGWPGQANYGAANTFLDAFVKYRQSQGMVASVIDLGLMADIGYVSEAALNETFELARANALQTLDERQFLQGLEAAIFANRLGYPNQIAVGLGTTSLAPKSDSIGKLSKDRRFGIWKNLLSSVDCSPTSPKGDQLRAYLDSVKENPELLDEPDTEGKIITELGKLIVSYTSGSEDMTQEEYANIVIDSLMTFEIRTWFRGHANIEISLGEVSNAGTVGGLTKVALKKLREKYRPKAPADDKETPAEPPDEEEDEEVYKEDIALGRTIRPDSTLFPDWTSPSEGRVFFTGATGFVGAFFLERLMRLPEVKEITCLVRTSTAEAGMARLKKTFQKFNLSMDAASQAKITIVPGDSTEEWLSLGQEAFERIGAWASVIFHFGAYANYVLPYSMHRNANVLGLLELLRFANSGRLKAIHYCSSISACGIPKDPSEEVLEDARPKVESHEFEESIGYTRSKFVGENIMWNAIENGFPISIYRPPVIAGHSETGTCKEEDMINRLYSNCLRAGAYPKPPDQPTQFVPVDFVCEAILEISRKSDSIGHAFNVIQPDQSKIIKFEETFQILNQFCPTPMRCVSSAEWIEKYSEVKDLQVRVKSHLVTPQLSQRAFYWDNWNYSAKYSTVNLRRGLADRRDILELKPMPELLEAYYMHWTSNG